MLLIFSEDDFSMGFFKLCFCQGFCPWRLLDLYKYHAYKWAKKNKKKKIYSGSSQL